VFCTRYTQKDWHQRLGFGVHADAIMDHIVHNTIWVETGGHNMREHTVGKITAKPLARSGASGRRPRDSLAPGANISGPRKQY
jgi:hypothetical protein